MDLFVSKRVYILFFILSLLFLTACTNSEDSQAESGNTEDNYTIRLASVISEDTPLQKAALEFQEELEDESNGRLKLEIFPNGQLYSSERETIEAIQMNNVEMSVVATAVMGNFIPEFSVFNLPFVFNDRDDAYSALDGEVGEILNERLLEENLVGLGYGENGFRHFLNNNKPIEKPEDLVGLEFRVIENPMYEDLFRELGANPSPMGFGETYTAIQQGVYDGMDSEIVVTATSKLDEVLDYFTLSGHAYMATVNIINRDFFEELPDDLQSILVSSAEKFNKRTREITIQSEGEYLEQLSQTMEVNELSEAQKEEFQNILQPLYGKYSGEIGEKLMELVGADDN